MIRHAVWTVGVVFTWTAAAGAQQATMLDIVPADSAIAVAIRDLDDLQKKGDKLVADAELNISIRPSQLFSMAFGFLGIQGGLDERAPAAVILLRPEHGKELGFPDLEALLVGVLPFTDLDKMANNFGFQKGDLKPKTIMKGNGQNFGKYFYAHGKHLILAQSERPIQRILKGKSLRDELPQKNRRSMADCDILLHLNPKALNAEWENILRLLDVELPRGDDPAEQQIVKQFVASLRSVRYGVAGFRIDDGLGASFEAVYDDDKGARDFLATLRSGTGASHLKGLPEGRVIAAQAHGTDGSKNVLLARLVASYLLKQVLETRQIVSATDRPSFVGVFTEVWQRLRGSRFAVYLTPDETRLGLFSLVAILDTEDGARFLADLRVLAKMADASSLDLKGRPPGDDLDIGKLVRDLGDKVYRVREGANLRLRLIGEPALPYLEKAITAAPDLETVRRAQKLKLQISEVAAERRKELLAKDLPKFVRPTFAFVPKAERRAGYDVDIVSVKLNERDLPINQQMQQLMGADWDKLRLAIHGKQVVVLLGSDVELLETALANLRDGKPGLAGAKALTHFGQQAPASRSAEFHLAAQNWLELFQVDPTRLAPKPGQSLSSFALTVETDRLRADVYMPTSELRRLAKDKRLFPF